MTPSRSAPPKRGKPPRRVRKTKPGIPSVAVLDALARQVVMLRDKRTCQRCGKQYPEGAQGIQWCHMFTRRRHHTRWYPDKAAFAGCTGCHMYLDSNPEEKILFCRQRLGSQDYELLRSYSENAQKIDRAAIKVWLGARLRELEGR